MPEKEYIERECAYKACEKYFNGVCGYDVSESEVINDFEKIIDSVPTADVAPVRHGRWETGYFHDRVCSCCTHPDNDLEERAHRLCPHCGAKMDGKKRDENA